MVTNTPFSKFPDGKIPVRGIPMAVDEVVAFELELGGQLFDESTFDTADKKIACANVIRVLDVALKRWQVKHNTKNLPTSLDISDPGWIYVPKGLFPPDSPMVAMPSKDSPAGKCGWFRIKRYFKSIKM